MRTGLLPAILLAVASAADGGSALSDVSASDASASALSEFGLPGTWSPDCGKGASPQNPRVKYEVPAQGPALWKFTADGRTVALHGVLSRAAMVTDRTIRFLYEEKGRPPLSITVQKDGRRIRVTEVTSAKGEGFIVNGVVQALGEPSPSYERCREGGTADELLSGVPRTPAVPLL
jgi:hypothetical protein